jgi:carbon storage regulator
MLVLTRKEDESIMIGDSIEIKVLELRENQVKLGIEAPRSIPVHRKEVYLSIKNENEEAARMKSPSGEIPVFPSKKGEKKNGNNH